MYTRHNRWSHLHFTCSTGFSLTSQKKMVKRAKCDVRLGSEIRKLMQVHSGKNILNCDFSTISYITLKPAAYHNVQLLFTDCRKLRNIYSTSEDFDFDTGTAIKSLLRCAFMIRAIRHYQFHCLFRHVRKITKSEY